MLRHHQGFELLLQLDQFFHYDLAIDARWGRSCRNVDELVSLAGWDALVLCSAFMSVSRIHRIWKYRLNEADPIVPAAHAHLGDEFHVPPLALFYLLQTPRRQKGKKAKKQEKVLKNFEKELQMKSTDEIMPRL
jgi:hypothetical protein